VFNKRIHWGIPTDDEIKEAATNRFRELEPFFKRVGFTLEHARKALDRVNSKPPPNGEKSQQFKDSALWEAVLESSASCIIYFITDDNDFYAHSSDKKDQLAVNLADECESLGAAVRLFRDISSCLRVFEEENELAVPNLTSVASSIESTIDLPFLLNLSKEQRYYMKEGPVLPSVQAYLTDDAKELAMIFELAYPLEYCREDGLDIRQEPFLKVRGDCFCNSETSQISDTRVTQLEFTYLTAWGGRGSSISGFGYPLNDSPPSWTKAMHPTIRLTVTDNRD